MALFSRFNLGGAFRDLSLFLRTRERHEYGFALLALAVTGFIVFAFWKDSSFPVEPQVVYVNSWRLDRSDAQIKKEITAEAAQRKAAAEARRREFQKLADQLGIK